MVGDDHVDGQFIGAAHHFGGADSGVHAHDEPHPFGGGGFDHFGAHAIAIFEAVWNVITAGAAGQLDGLGQKHHRGGSIHIVVAVDQDLLPLADGFPQARDGPRHVAHGERVVELVERRLEEAARGGGVAQAAVHQNSRGRSADAEGG